MKERVRLESRIIKGGVKSLFLDYWVHGQRVRESLGMYIIPEDTKLARIKNAETLKTAEAIKAKRIIDIQNGDAGFYVGKKSDVMLSEYLSRMDEDLAYNTRRCYETVVKHLKNYGDIRVSGVTAEYIRGFIKYMKKVGVGQPTVAIYIVRIKTMLHRAVKEKIIRNNPVDELDPKERNRGESVQREYLTLEEVRRIIEVQNVAQDVKPLFLFSCFTGLRYVDIMGLKWKHIVNSASGKTIEMRQQKTSQMVMIPLNENALAQLPEKEGDDDDFVFPQYSYPKVFNQTRTLIKAAGIKKHISFHCARHTYATLLLTYGADIYTVSKLLGHRSITTTQIYAEVVNQKKVDAVNAIPKLDI